jgi:hypothetical protein
MQKEFKMKINTISNYNYQTQNNTPKSNTKPSFGAKFNLDLDTKLIYDLESLELDYGIRGFLRGKPLKTAMEKLSNIYTDHTVDFSYEKPICYGFNYIAGNGVAMSDAKLVATNITTGKTKKIDYNSNTDYPFLELVKEVISSKNFWNK